MVYFFSIHVPNDIINLLTGQQLLEIYLFGVKLENRPWIYVHGGYIYVKFQSYVSIGYVLGYHLG